MALSKNTPRTFKQLGERVVNRLPVEASNTIYVGSAISIASGYAQPLAAGDSTDGFAGFSDEYVDNSSGANGAKNVNVVSKGIVTLSVTGASAVTHVNDAVYATDDGTFTLTASGGLQIGKVHRWVTGTTCEVYFEAATVRSI